MSEYRGSTSNDFDKINLKTIRKRTLMSVISIPTASENTLGDRIEYNGKLYKCLTDGSIYFWSEIANGVIEVFDNLPSTNIVEEAIYRLNEYIFNHGDDTYSNLDIIAYRKIGNVLTIDSDGITESGILTPWSAVTSSIIDGYVSSNRLGLITTPAREWNDAIKGTIEIIAPANKLYFDYVNSWSFDYIFSYHNYANGRWIEITGGGGGGSTDVIIDVNSLPTSNIKDDVFYRTKVLRYTLNNEIITIDTFYIITNANYVLSGTDIVDNTDSENPVILVSLGDSVGMTYFITNHPSDISTTNSLSNSVFVLSDGDYFKSNSITATELSQIQYHKNGQWHIVDNLQIDNVFLTPFTTRQSLKLIGEADLFKSSEFTTPKANGIDIVLNEGASPNPSIINDNPSYKYANNKTSSNNYINTRLETIERKADSKTITKFVDALPSNPDLNTEYYVTTATENVYDRYFVDSLGNVKGLGTTQMDVSTLATKQELSLKEDVSNKVTTLDNYSTDTQYPSAKSVVDYVAENGGGRIVETVLWESPNGIAGTSFYSNPTNITLTDNIKDYYLFKFTVNRDNNKFLSFFLTIKDIQLFSGSSYKFITSISFDAETSYLLVNIPTTTDTNILGINSSNKCNLVNIVGYKSIPMINTYSTEIRELIMNTRTGGVGPADATITLTKEMSNFDYLEFYFNDSASNSNNYLIQKIAVHDLINLFNSSSSKFVVFGTSGSSNKGYALTIYRTSNTTLSINYNNMALHHINGIKAEPVVQNKNIKFTTLWKGTLTAVSATATLSQSINNFSLIIVKTDNTVSGADWGQQNNVYVPSLTPLNTNICIPTTDGNSNSYYITYAFTNATTLKIKGVSRSRVLGVYGMYIV